jgi:hypothetical protein
LKTHEIILASLPSQWDKDDDSANHDLAVAFGAAIDARFKQLKKTLAWTILGLFAWSALVASLTSCGPALKQECKNIGQYKCINNSVAVCDGKLWSKQQYCGTDYECLTDGAVGWCSK